MAHSAAETLTGRELANFKLLATPQLAKLDRLDKPELQLAQNKRDGRDN